MITSQGTSFTSLIWLDLVLIFPARSYLPAVYSSLVALVLLLYRGKRAMLVKTAERASRRRDAAATNYGDGSSKKGT